MRNSALSGLRALLASAAVCGLVLAGPAQADEFAVAYISASSANTWLAASRHEMDRIAADAGITLTEFDAQFDPARQATQMQDVISSGRYDGIIVVPINGPGLVPDVEAALAEGLKVVVLNQILGTDLTTSDPQVEGVSASVLAAPFRSGQRYGNLTVRACAGLDPCKVVYFYGIKGIPLDVALRDGFDSVISAHPNITVVAEGEGKYLGPDQGLLATQDILQIEPQFDVLLGPDQAVQGAAIALEDEGLSGTVRLIGLGGSTAALEGIAGGQWFGGVMGAPGTEGRLAMQAMRDALTTGAAQGGIDPLLTLPDNGEVTQENIGAFTAEWGG